MVLQFFNTMQKCVLGTGPYLISGEGQYGRIPNKTHEHIIQLENSNFTVH